MGIIGKILINFLPQKLNLGELAIVTVKGNDVRSATKAKARHDMGGYGWHTSQWVIKFS